jgi:hypothetical protein
MIQYSLLLKLGTHVICAFAIINRAIDIKGDTRFHEDVERESGKEHFDAAEISMKWGQLLLVFLPNDPT